MWQKVKGGIAVEEIKVGYFIRTNKGIIGKLKRIELDEIDKNLKWYVFDKKRPDMNIIDEIYINKPYITKYSKNIIDLIEIGDYVNGRKVMYIRDYEEFKRLDFDEDMDDYIYKEDIKTILTKEQMEANQYVVKRNMETN